MESAEEEPSLRRVSGYRELGQGLESGQATCAAGRQIPKARTPASVGMKCWISNMGDMSCRLKLIGLRWLSCPGA